MKKTFKRGDAVRVKPPGERAFVGKVYSQWKSRGPKSERIIGVEKLSGAGVGYRVRYVTAA